MTFYRLANMRLYPLHQRQPNYRSKRPQVYWSDNQRRAVSRLIDEASSLLNMFDDVSLLLGPETKLNNPIKMNEDPLPPSKWDPILTKSCEILKEELNKFKPHNFRNHPNF